MEWLWVVGLVAMIVVPLAIIIWWIPWCDRSGIEKARERVEREAQWLAPSP
jgi:hypothetical protein